MMMAQASDSELSDLSENGAAPRDQDAPMATAESPSQPNKRPRRRAAKDAGSETSSTAPSDPARPARKGPRNKPHSPHVSPEAFATSPESRLVVADLAWLVNGDKFTSLSAEAQRAVLDLAPSWAVAPQPDSSVAFTPAFWRSEGLAHNLIVYRDYQYQGILLKMLAGARHTRLEHPEDRDYSYKAIHHRYVAALRGRLDLSTSPDEDDQYMHRLMCPADDDEDWKDINFSEWCSEETRPNAAGESANVLLADLLKAGAILPGDILRYRKIFQLNEELTVLAFLQVTSVNKKAGTISLSEVADETGTPLPNPLEIKNNDSIQKIETVLFYRATNNRKVKRPNGNAWRNTSLLRAGDKPVPLFELRKNHLPKATGSRNKAAFKARKARENAQQTIPPALEDLDIKMPAADDHYRTPLGFEAMCPIPPLNPDLALYVEP